MNVGRSLWPILLTALVPALALIGLFRVVEVVAISLLRASGRDDPSLATILGLGAVLTVAGLIGALFWRLNRFNNRHFTYTHSEGRDPTPEERKEREALAQLVQGADDTSPLKRVVAIGQTFAAEDVSVDLIALELRETGGRLTAVVRDPLGKMLEQRFHTRLIPPNRPGPDDWPAQLRPVIHLADDLGTTYVTWTSGGSGSAGNYRHDLLIGPAIPDGVTRIAIVVERLTDEEPFGPPRSREARVIPGPWRFEVSL